ncbi:glycoside hydrolase family 9 protein [Chitinophaga sp. CF118]|uniref:glycoside hydrolase family 9 protein n=1 Tax=Chitinophaga sp. CF118 TaxID=1884367 RepID=UPI001C4304F4|nr:glycoside hydrolase family 9 protein [Chitinophaga sp. CF118]
MSLNTAAANAQGISDDIKINQVGFYPNEPKVAVVMIADAAGKPFRIIAGSTGNVVFNGVLEHPVLSAYSSLKTCEANFSQLHDTGSFYLDIKGVGRSCNFKIQHHVFREVAIASLKAFYYQRASMPLLPAFAGKWSRKEGHPDTTVLIHSSAAFKKRATGSAIATPGGWYDAGDYNKYVVNSGISTATLLSAYEDFPRYFDSLNTNIPESRNRVPDILDEALYNMRWMLSMQDPQDGGVYNKCTNANFDGMIMPDKAIAPRYVVQKGTAAALNLVAVMAQGARIFRKYGNQFPGLADSCQSAAERAWSWALKNPDMPYNQDEMNKEKLPQITTGGYGDKNFGDEWLWAAAELFTTTGSKMYFEKVLAQMREDIRVPSWSSVGMLGYYTLLRHENQMPEYAKVMIRIMKNRLLTLADNYMPANTFHTVMGNTKKDFIWGSNSVAANQGILLMNAYLVAADKKYLEWALTNIDYLLGRNATGYCFVTGIGCKSPMHPHHRPSIADGINEPVPGLLVGGPNEGRQDKVNYEHKEPETSYTDQDGAYASNEIAINWNAPLVYLVSAMEVLSRK